VRPVPLLVRTFSAGEDEIGIVFFECASEDGLGIHALPIARESTCLELTDRDFRFHRHVFDQNQSNWLHETLPRR
jgi:hypothetical protein